MQLYRRSSVVSRVIWASITLLLCFSLLAVVSQRAMAAETDFEIDGSGVITAYNGDETGELVIPDKINGITVTGIDWGGYAGDFVTVTVPASVTSIGEFAFMSYGDLGAVYFLGAAPTFADNSFDQGIIIFCPENLEAEYVAALTAAGYPSWYYELYPELASTIKDEFEVDAIGKITKYNGSGGTVTISPTIGGKTITAIGSNVFNGKGITSLTLPSTLTTIGANAFANNTGLASITIPESVTGIGAFAFSGCTSLAEVKFDGKAKPTIDANAFQGTKAGIKFICHIDLEEYYQTALAAYLLPSGTGTMETTGTPMFSFVDDGTGAGYVLSKYVGTEANITVPATYKGKPVTGIGDEAFSKIGSGKDTTTQSIILPASIRTIGRWAFGALQNMQSITLNEGLESIGSYAFQYCNSLTDIIIPQSVTTIEEDAIPMCDKLVNITVAPDNANYMDIDGVLFSKDGKTLINYPCGRPATTYTVPNGTVAIAPRAFKLYYAQTATHPLVTVTFPDTLESVGNGAFFQSGITSVSLRSNLNYGEHAFDLCTRLSTVVVEEGVISIPNDLFYGCEGIKSLTLPTTLRTIGARAFDRLGYKYKDTAPVPLNLPEGLLEIGEDAFALANVESITFPKSLTKIGTRAFYLCKSLKSIDFAAGSALKGISAYAFNNCHNLSSISLPPSLQTLDMGVFSHCYALQSITLPNSITSLDNSVFAGSGLVSIELPSSIKNMGSCMFRDCGNLQSAKMPAFLETLGTCTFENCVSLTNIIFPDTIKLNKVPADTFFNCLIIESIYLPKAIAETEACAFSNCKELKEIKYANKNLKRNIFDCYAIDPGDFYELREDGYYYTTADFSDPTKNNNDSGAYQGVKDLEEEAASGPQSKAAASQEALCGGFCAPGSTKLTATSNPSFKYVGEGNAPDPGPVTNPPSRSSGTGSGVSVLNDGTFGVRLSGAGIPQNTVLTVNRTDFNSLPAMLQVFVSSKEVIASFDISLSQDFNGSITVELPVGKAYEGKTVTILHYNNGEVDTYQAVVTNGVAKVTVTSLSPFVIATGNSTIGPPKTGDVPDMFGLGILLLCGIALILYRITAQGRKPI